MLRVASIYADNYGEELISMTDQQTAEQNTARASMPKGRGPAKPPAAKPAATVVVCSKLPQDLELQLTTFREVRIPGRNGDVIERQGFKAGKTYFIHGTAYPAGQAPKGYPRRPHDADGYALTYGIPADFWNDWEEMNRETDMVRNRVVFAMPDVDAACAMAAENVDVNSGLDPLVEGDVRNPKPINGAVAKITADGESMSSRPQTPAEAA
jgi:hypothetical protein